MGSPRKGGVSTRGETLAKELNLERSDFVLDRQPDAFRSGRSHQWLTSFLHVSLFFEVCEQVLKGIVYTLAVKSTQVLDLVYQKERVALV